MIVTTEYKLGRIEPPRLPDATRMYDPAYIDQLNNVLRLYFNRLTGLLNQLDANSTLNTISTTVYTVTTLPSAVTNGMGTRAFVSDALAPTFGATVVAGGAVATPVYSDGTNWKVG